ncbi:hypothetical protein Clacol_008881 [Clathrus columnatus]|uniref:Uncharacterized protein n=1 Tax=Clathrus columnatus TaxID=1419009 RepID=A0AAV5AP55_9AGAM|nr:hypothetical protein Clacol_008881 [Clathrus columnatus]
MCGSFAEIGSGFNDATLFTLTAFNPSKRDPTAGTDLVIAALTATGNPVLLASPAGISRTIFNLTDGTLFIIDREAFHSRSHYSPTGSDVSLIPTNGERSTIVLSLTQTLKKGLLSLPLLLNGTTGESTVVTGTQVVVFRPMSGKSEYDASTCTSANINRSRI